MLTNSFYRSKAQAPNSASSAQLAGVYSFRPSGSAGLQTLPGSTAHGLGSSDLSFESSRKLCAVASALLATATFSNANAIAQVMEPAGITIPAERICKPAVAICRDSIETAEKLSLSAILRQLDEEPIEDGINHRSQASLDLHIDKYGTRNLAWYFESVSEPSLAAPLLRLFGRSGRIDATTRKALVQSALSSASIEVRDAAIQAVENWEDKSLIEVLTAHSENVQWLAQYSASVIRDLGA